MDKFRHHKEGEDNCRQGIGWKKSCADCLFDTLCLYERNQETILKNSRKINSDLEEDKFKNLS